MKPEDARQHAMDRVTAAAEERVAITLKKQFGNLGIIYDDLDTEVEDKEYRHMAHELIEKREFNASSKSGNPLTISLQDLDKKVSETQPEMKTSLGIDSFEELVPTREQLNAASEAVGDGVKEHTGGIGFLGGATFMNAIKGFMKWIGGLFSGESSFSMDSLKQSIAKVTAENMEESVTDNLNALREKYPSMNRFLSDATIQNVGRQVNNAALTEAGIAVSAAAATAENETLENTVQATVNSNQLADNRIEIREAILHPKGGPSLAEEIAGQYSDATKAHDESRGWYNPAGWFDAGVVSAEDALPTGEAMADTIASTVSQTITDPSFRTVDGRKLSELNKQEFTDVLTDEVGKAMQRDEDKYDLPVALSDKSAVNKNKTNLEVFKDKIHAKLSEESPDGMQASAYDQLSMAARYTAQTSIPDDARQQADRAVDPDVRAETAKNGAHDVEDGTHVAASTHQSQRSVPWYGRNQ